MPDAKTYLAEPPLFLVLALGPPNSGKSDLAMSFPSCYVASFDPEGFAILKADNPRAKKLASNLRYIEVFNPHGEAATRRLYERTKALLKPEEVKVGSPQKYAPVDASDLATHLLGWLRHVEEVASAGEIKTIVLDGFNYLTDGKEFLCRNDPKNIVQTSDGPVLNGRAAYSDLKNWLSQFMWSELLPLCTRFRLNLVVTCHIQRLSEEAIEGAKKGDKQITVGKVQQDSDIAPQIAGKFKEAIEGKFGAVIYTDHQIRTVTVPPPIHQEHVYYAYCNKVSAFESQANAKNKYGLPDRLDLTEKSFYEELMTRNGGMSIATENSK